jgi:hypothetical protein
LISSTSGRLRWMTSAAFRACALSGVDRSATSWPAAARLSEALNVANRTFAPNQSLDASAGAARIVPPSAAIAVAATR